MEPTLDPSTVTSLSHSETPMHKSSPEGAYELMLAIRRAYEADRPLYPSHDIARLKRFVNDYNAEFSSLNSYQALDYLGNEQWWEFSEEQLQTARLDLSPIQWLITMPFLCNHPNKTLTRAFSLAPFSSIHQSAEETVLDGFKNNSNIAAIDDPGHIQRRFVDYRSKWNESKYKVEIDAVLKTAFNRCLDHDYQHITRILVLGAGALELDIADHLKNESNNWPSMTKHAFAFDLKSTLEDLSSNSKIELVLQDPKYTHITKEVIRVQEPTVNLVGDDTLNTILGVDKHTLLFASNFTAFPLKQIIAEYATATPCEQRLPTVIIWEEGIHITWEDMEKEAIEESLTNSSTSSERKFRDSPRTNRLEQLYDKFDFPTPEKGDPDPRLAIYVRK
ncbi:hypothetical protein F4678DRAFT_479983 [Xylaria arbuscula]|nr:hypothetical protein F4678DRAFT_479983 [Xylaria arbuscula]